MTARPPEVLHPQVHIPIRLGAYFDFKSATPRDQRIFRSLWRDSVPIPCQFEFQPGKRQGLEPTSTPTINPLVRIDTERSCLNKETVGDLCCAALSVDLVPIARPSTKDAPHLGRPLDNGAMGGKFGLDSCRRAAGYSKPN